MLGSGEAARDMRCTDGNCWVWNARHERLLHPVVLIRHL
jgi:hypothetical protein